jgi:hypothetical protein
LHDLVASGAAHLDTNVANDLERLRNAFQVLRDIRAELAQLTATIGAAVLSWRVHDDFARQVFRKRLARRLVPDGLIGGDQIGGFACGLVGLEFLELQLKLTDVTLELLALGAEHAPLHLLDDQLQMLDLLFASGERLVPGGKLSVLPR